MPPVIPVAAALIANVGFGIKGAALIAIGLGASVATSIGTSLLAPEPTSALQNGSIPGTTVNGHLVNGRSTQDPFRVIYGEAKTGGSIKYMHVTGENNKYFHFIIDWGEGEIEGPVEVDGVPQLWADDKLFSDYGDKLYHEFFNGAPDQPVCTTLQEADPRWTDRKPWSAYSYIRLEYDDDKFIGFPVFTGLFRGRKIYDPRSALTAWSQNGILCFYDWVRNVRFGGGIAADFWDQASVIAAANAYDAKGWQFNGILLDRESMADTRDKMLACCRSAVVPSAGMYKILFLDYDAPVMSLDDNDFIADSADWDMPTVQNLCNTVNVKFPDKDNGYVMNDFPVPALDAVADDGQVTPKEVFFPFVSDRATAAALGAYNLERNRLDKSYPIRCRQKAFPLEPGDMVDVTCSYLGWSAKRVRVRDCGMLSNEQIGLVLIPEDPLLYDPVVNLGTIEHYTTNLPDGLAIPPQVSNVHITEELFTIKDNSYVRVKISWERPPNYPFLDYVEVWVSRDDINYTHYTDAATPGGTGSISIEPLKDGEKWYIKLAPVSIQGKKRTLDTTVTYEYTIIGKDAAPADVTGFMASATGDMLHLRWNQVDEDDLKGYEIRYGAVWPTSVFFGFVGYKSNFLSLSGVRPGTHTFCIKAKDTLNNYSVNAVTATVVLFDPPNYTEKHSLGPNDFSTGTHNNTEAYDDPVIGRVLRVTHAAGLAGDYTSPVYDMGSPVKRRHWLNYELIMNATGATWEGGIRDRTWEEALGTRSWMEQFSNVQMGTITMKFFYSPDGANWYECDHFEILAFEVEARYIKYQISIADNDSASWIYVKPPTEKAFYWQ